MTIDTVLKTMLGRTDALVHGFVALMQDELHVIAQHDLFRFDTFVALIGINLEHR